MEFFEIHHKRTVRVQDTTQDKEKTMEKTQDKIPAIDMAAIMMKAMAMYDKDASTLKIIAYGSTPANYVSLITGSTALVHVADQYMKEALEYLQKAA